VTGSKLLSRFAPGPALAGLAFLCLFAGVSLAAGVAEPQDLPYPGTIRLEVDASDLDHRVMTIRELVPVETAGALTLLYPQWLPGNHSPTGPVELLSGLRITDASTGAAISWQRDPVSMHAFHLDVPTGVTALQLEFHYVTPTVDRQGRRVMTPDSLGLQWEKTLLYPAGYYASRIAVQPAVTLPPGWHFASALDGAERAGDTIRFAPVSLEMLVDSPLFAGRHFKRFNLDPDPVAPVRLNVFADRPAELEASPEQIEAHRRLVRETLALFGSRHYRHYDFLLSISGTRSGIGLEHHQSSENGVDPGYFIDWDGTATTRDLLGHEFVHSWNGKFRRPADLTTSGFEVPMRNSLLWVYEGMTEFWGLVLTARSGLWSPEFSRDALAWYAATYDQGRPGRSWRKLQDTTNQPIIAYGMPQDYPSWQRAADYYGEGALLWLDVDMELRQLSKGRRSLDDFSRKFLGMRDGELGPLVYDFDEVARTLGDVADTDWTRFLRERLDGQDVSAGRLGLERSGWRLIYVDKPSTYVSTRDKARKNASFSFSLGLSLATADGKVTEVVWDSPAFKAGVAPGMTLLAVNGRAWSPEVLSEAITAAKSDEKAIDLLLRQDDLFRTIPVDYRGGLRYPQLERVEGRKDRLSELLAPRNPAKRAAD
jgi:predicted metalloprotease with PDZ domain